MSMGEKPPSEDELISVTEWNHRHGRNFIHDSDICRGGLARSRTYHDEKENDKEKGIVYHETQKHSHSCKRHRKIKAVLSRSFRFGYAARQRR